LGSSRLRFFRAINPHFWALLASLYCANLQIFSASNMTKLRAGIAYSQKGDIQVQPAPNDLGAGGMVLHNVAVVQEGEAKGHGLYLDSDFIADVARLGNAAVDGIKVLFDHQTHCGTTMGYSIGKFRNFRVDGTRVIADLHLFESGKISPHGDLVSYIQQLANEAPDVFGNSIEFLSGESYYKTDKGFNIIRRYDENEGVDKYFVGEVFYDKKLHGEINWDKRFATIIELPASALVNEPAATNGLFSQVLEVFGANFGAKKKALSIKTLLESIAILLQEGEKEFITEPKIANDMKFDITAETDAGASLVIATDKDSIRVGDTVTDNTGAAAPDGDHNITSSSSGESNITITVVGGKITKIEETTAPDATLIVAASETTPSVSEAKFDKMMREMEIRFENKLNALEKKVFNTPASKPSAVDRAGENNDTGYQGRIKFKNNHS
jgi:hypothetical protein